MLVTLKSQNGEYYDIIFVHWELGLSAGNLSFELDINNNNNNNNKKNSRPSI